MQSFKFDELPEHIATCDHYLQTRQLFPYHEEFAILESYYFPDISAADPLKLLEFDFKYGLSREYKVKVLLHIYQLWENSVEPFNIPEFDSYLGKQLKYLFEFSYSRLTTALRTNSCELFLALEFMYGKDYIQCELNTNVIYTNLCTIIRNNSEDILLLILERKYTITAYSIEITEAINSNSISMLKIINSIAPAPFRYIENNKITNISYEIFMYLVNNKFYDIDTVDFTTLYKLALVSNDYVQILDIYKNIPNKDIIIRAVRDSLQCKQDWGNGHFPSNHHITVAEYIINKYQIIIPTEIFQHALENAFKRHRNNCGRDFVLLCVKYGAIITNNILQDSYTNINIDCSPGFMKSLM
jgi:hypothetical protein